MFMYLFGYRNPSISTINAVQKSAGLRKFCVERDQKRMVIQVMHENLNTIFKFPLLIIVRHDKYK